MPYSSVAGLCRHENEEAIPAMPKTEEINELLLSLKYVISSTNLSDWAKIGSDNIHFYYFLLKNKTISWFNINIFGFILDY